MGAVTHRLEEGKSANENAETQRGWIMMSHIGWGEEHTTIYKGVETSLEAQKGSYLRANENAETQRGVDYDVPHWLGRRTHHHL